MGGGRVGKKRLPTDMGVMLRIGKAKTSTKICRRGHRRHGPVGSRRAYNRPWREPRSSIILRERQAVPIQTGVGCGISVERDALLIGRLGRRIDAERGIQGLDRSRLPHWGGHASHEAPVLPRADGQVYGGTTRRFCATAAGRGA